MEQRWAVERLEAFVAEVEEYQRLYTESLSSLRNVALEAELGELGRRLWREEAAIQVIIDAVAPELGNYVSPDEEHGSNRWKPAKLAALRVIGRLTSGAEAKVRMQPDAPELIADRLHTWVWDAARQMWEVGSRQAAVHRAAQSIYCRLQQKLGRFDLSEVKLCREAFSPNVPQVGQARLRFVGDRNTDTWKTLQAGALDYSAGCFMAIRNPLAHNPDFPLTAQEALEQLAALSVLARWIDAAEIEIA